MHSDLQKIEDYRKDNYVSDLLKKGFEFYPIFKVEYSPRGPANQCEQNSLSYVKRRVKMKMSFEEWQKKQLEPFHGRTSWLSEPFITQTKYQQYLDKFEDGPDLMYGYIIVEPENLIHHWMVFEKRAMEVTMLRHTQNVVGYLMKKMDKNSWVNADNYWDVKQGKLGFNESIRKTIYKMIITESIQSVKELKRYLIGRRKLSQSEMENISPSFTYSLKHGILMSIPIAIIDGLDPEPSSWTDDNGEVKEYKKGHRIKEPIEVEYDSELELFNLQNGNHRIKQAKLNGDDNILAFVQMPRLYDYEVLLKNY